MVSLTEATVQELELRGFPSLMSILLALQFSDL